MADALNTQDRMRELEEVRHEVPHHDATNIYLCSFTVLAHRHRLFRSRNRLLHLGWAGSFWLSEGWARNRSDQGYVGVLDAWLSPVPHRGISDRGIDLVQRFRKRGAVLHGGRGIHGVRNPLVRDGPSTLHRVERGARRVAEEVETGFEVPAYEAKAMRPKRPRKSHERTVAVAAQILSLPG